MLPIKEKHPFILFTREELENFTTFEIRSQVSTFHRAENSSFAPLDHSPNSFSLASTDREPSATLENSSS